MGVAHQALLSMGFPRQEYWSKLSFPFSGDLPTWGLKLCLMLGRRILYHWATWKAHKYRSINVHLTYPFLLNVYEALIKTDCKWFSEFEISRSRRWDRNLDACHLLRQCFSEASSAWLPLLALHPWFSPGSKLELLQSSSCLFSLLLILHGISTCSVTVFVLDYIFKDVCITNIAFPLGQKRDIWPR